MWQLRRFVLMAALWLPMMFLLWFVLRSAIVFPIIRTAAFVLHAWMPEVFGDIGQYFNYVDFEYSLRLEGVAGLPSADVVIDEQRINVLVFCYGMAVFGGLVMATPLAWRHVFAQLGFGFAVLVLTSTFGLLGEMLFTAYFGGPTAIYRGLIEGGASQAAYAVPAAEAARVWLGARLAAHGLGYDAVALWRQFGSLVVPSVAPIALWILCNRSFLEVLVGWREPPDDLEGPKVALPGAPGEALADAPKPDNPPV